MRQGRQMQQKTPPTTKPLTRGGVLSVNIAITMDPKGANGLRRGHNAPAKLHEVLGREYEASLHVLWKEAIIKLATARNNFKKAEEQLKQ